jgi:hypothetical protein
MDDMNDELSGSFELVEPSSDYYRHRRDLRFALVSRVLTDAEMAEVASEGLSLFVEPCVSYFEIDKIKEMNECLLQQFKLRAVAASTKT